MIPHIRISGGILAAYGLSMTLLNGLIVLMMGGLTGVMALIGITEDEEALIGAFVYGILTVFIAVFALVPPLGALVSGIGVAMEKNWARIPAMLFGAIIMMNVPLGTCAGLYVIYVLMQKDVGEYLARGGA